MMKCLVVPTLTAGKVSEVGAFLQLLMGKMTGLTHRFVMAASGNSQF